MTKVNAKTVVKLLERIVELEGEIRTAGELGRKQLADVNLAPLRSELEDASGNFDEAAWEAKSEDEQHILRHRLIQVSDTLDAAGDVDGPAEPGHIMNKQYASNTTIVMLIVLSFAAGIAILATIVGQWDAATDRDSSGVTSTIYEEIKILASLSDEIEEAEDDVLETTAELNAASTPDERSAPLADLAQRQAKLRDAESRLVAATAAAEKASLDAIRDLHEKPHITEASVLLMVILLGALGGAAHLISSLVKYVGNRRLMRSWVLYYWAMPLGGATLAPIVYMLLRVGILSPSGTSQDGSNIASLNLIGIYAFAALSGLFARTAMEKLAEVFQTLFQTASKSKDPVGAKSPEADARQP